MPTFGSRIMKTLMQIKERARSPACTHRPDTAPTFPPSAGSGVLALSTTNGFPALPLPHIDPSGLLRWELRQAAGTGPLPRSLHPPAKQPAAWAPPLVVSSLTTNPRTPATVSHGRLTPRGERLGAGGREGIRRALLCKALVSLSLCSLDCKWG